MNTEHETTTELVEIEPQSHATPAEQVLTQFTLADYTQFLYDTHYGGVKGKDFTAEGIKTLGLNNGISTGDVRVEFINPEKTQALFYCTATDRHGNTSQRVVKQCEKENGRVNPHWIEKGIARAERNAIKSRLPVQLFKTALQKAIQAGEAKQSAIVETQQALTQAWENRHSTIRHIDKRTFFDAAQAEYGESEHWDAEAWQQVTSDLNTLANWVVRLTEGSTTDAP